MADLLRQLGPAPGAAELLAASQGLGYLIQMGRRLSRPDIIIVGMLTSAAFGVFPCVMPSNIEPSQSLTIYNSATAAYGMKVGLAWWIPGMILVAGYFVYTYRNFAGKVSLEGEGY